VKSAQVRVDCTVHETNNMYLKAIYLLFFPYGSNTPDIQPSSFACFGSAVERAATSSVLEYQCKAVDGQCCCWTWMPNGGSRDQRDVDSDELIQGRVITAGGGDGACDMQPNQRWQFMTMAVGENPLMDWEEAWVIHTAGGSAALSDFTIPEESDPSPVQFELAINMDLDECSGDKTAGCLRSLEAELRQVLGISDGVVLTVSAVREK